MSNNPTIKIYTEEQVAKLTSAAYIAGRNNNTFIFGVEFEKITPIELPSDEEIWNEADKEECNSKHYAFTRGAKWMRDKISGGNK